MRSQSLTITSVGTARRWTILAVSMLSQATSAFFYHGAAFLIPALNQRRGLSLVQAGWVVAMPTLGVMLTLIAWGAAADRFGERRVLITGLSLMALAGGGAAVSQTVGDNTVVLAIFLFLGGMAGASTASASGRVVVGWFPAHRRGLAMGIRQMAQPLGVGLAAISIAGIAADRGIAVALWLPTGLAVVAVALCALVIIDPARPSRAAAADTGQLDNPYRRSSFLWRVHAVSVLLVVPQFTVWTYALVWLITDRGWTSAAAGTLVAITQLLGALGRIGAGQLSDLVGSRMRPLRWVAIAAAATMALLALTDHLDWSAAVVIMVIASVVTVADNGLAFTSIAERAGPFWSGRALGTQNTAQFLAASAVPPVVGALITAFGFPVAFAITALCPVVAAPLVPSDRTPGDAQPSEATGSSGSGRASDSRA